GASLEFTGIHFRALTEPLRPKRDFTPKKSAFLTMTRAPPSCRMRHEAWQFPSNKGGALEMRTKNSPEQIADTMIREVDPVLRKYAAQAEADRRLAPEAINAILDAGLM